MECRPICARLVLGEDGQRALGCLLRQLPSDLLDGDQIPRRLPLPHTLEPVGHKIANRQLAVGIRGYGREGLQDLALGPDAPECDRLAVDARHGEGRLAVGIVPPFVVRGSGHKAAALGEGRFEHSRLGYGLRAGVVRLLRLFREVRRRGDVRRR